jgi:hypothetical protein
MQSRAERVVGAPTDVAWGVLADPDRYAEITAALHRSGLATADGGRGRTACLHPNGLVWLPGFRTMGSVLDVARHRPYPDEFLMRVDHRPALPARGLLWTVRCTWTVADDPGGAHLALRVSLHPRLGPVGRALARLAGPRPGAVAAEVLDAWEAAIDSVMRVPLDDVHQLHA